MKDVLKNPETFTFYGDTEKFLNNGSFLFNNYGFKSYPDGSFFVYHGYQGEFLCSENIDKNSKFFLDFKNFFTDGSVLNIENVEKHLELLYKSQNNNNYHYKKGFYDNKTKLYSDFYPYYAICNGKNPPYNANTIIDYSKNRKHISIFHINNNLINKEIHSSYNNGDVHKFLNSWIKLTRDYYNKNKNLSYGLSGELQLLMENNIGEIYNTIFPYLEKNKNVTFEKFINTTKIGQCLLANNDSASLVLHPAQDMQNMTDYLDYTRDNYLTYKKEKEIENNKKIKYDNHINNKKKYLYNNKNNSKSKGNSL